MPRGSTPGRFGAVHGTSSDVFPLSEPQQEEQLQQGEGDAPGGHPPPPPPTPVPPTNGAHNGVHNGFGLHDSALPSGLPPGGDFAIGRDLGDGTTLFTFCAAPLPHGSQLDGDSATTSGTPAAPAVEPGGDPSVASPAAIATSHPPSATSAPRDGPSGVPMSGAGVALSEEGQPLPGGAGAASDASRELPDGTTWLFQENTPSEETAVDMVPEGAEREGFDAADSSTSAGTATSADAQGTDGLARGSEGAEMRPLDVPLETSDVEDLPPGETLLVDGLVEAADMSGGPAARMEETEVGVNGAAASAAAVGAGEGRGAGAAAAQYDACVPPFEEGGVVKCPIRLESGASMLPHPAKVARGGEDAFFIEGDWVGVADGVSGWAALGVNSGLYSRDLMWQCAEVVRWGEAGKDPRAVIEEAHSRTDFQGSCTVTVACLDDRVLRVANLGDSGFLLLRDRAVVERSQCMQHAFDSPFHIGKSAGDDPADSQLYELEVQPGDVLLLGTDGLYDNVFESQIMDIVFTSIAEGRSAEATAKRLSVAAQKNAACTTGTTPFCEEAKAAGNKYEGGKLDDITVIVSYLF